VAAKPLVRMALPKMTLAKEGGAKDSEAIDPLDCLLPKPNLDFSAAPAPGAANERRPLYDIYKPIRVGIGKFRLALISGLLLGVVLCGAWYMNWLPLPSLGGIAQRLHPANSKKVESGVAPHAAPAMASRTAATPNAASPDAVTTKPADEPVGGTVESENAPNTEAPAPDAIAPANSAALKVKKPVAPTASPARASAKEKAASAGSLRKNAPTAIPSATAEATPPEPAASDTTLVPPKLLKSASPVYPPDAMREYITGDVRVDALVEPDGRIGTMKILGGPVPLRQAALDALKQYEYAPGTSRGCPYHRDREVLVQSLNKPNARSAPPLVFPFPHGVRPGPFSARVPFLRHSERSLRSEVRFSIARFLCDESLFSLACFCVRSLLYPASAIRIISPRPAAGGNPRESL